MIIAWLVERIALLLRTGISSTSLVDGLTDGEEVLGGTDPLVADFTPPTILLTSPASGQTLVEGETIQISADATDDGRVTAVEFFVDGSLFDSDNTAPYETPFTVPLGESSVTIEAVATDTNGNIASTGAQAFAVIPDPLFQSPVL